MGMIWVAYRRDRLYADALIADPELIEDLLESDDDVTSVDIDKAWHGVHWLLTGSAEPDSSIASNVIFGGQPVGDPDEEMIQVIDEPRVARIASYLAELDRASLRARFDPQAMIRADVYPSGIWEEPELLEDYLLPPVEQLKEFYSSAAHANEVVIVTLV